MQPIDISSPWNYKVLSDIFVKIELITLFCDNLLTYNLYVSPISSNMYRNHTVLKRPLAQWVQVESFTNVSFTAGVCATIEDIRRHVCREYFACIKNIFITISSG